MVPIRRSLPFVLTFAALAAPVAQEPSVVFRSTVDLVTVDATVLGADGRPLRGLGPDDFVLEVDGRRRPVVSAQWIEQASGARPRELAAAYFSSNEHVDPGRFITIAVDEAHIRRLEGRTALRAAANFIDSLRPNDNVAVVGLSRVGTIDFTRDRLALKRRLEGLVGHTDPVFLQFNIGLQEAVEVADGNRTRLADVVLRECGRSLSEYTSTARLTDEVAGRDPCPEQVEQEARAVAQHARTQASISLSALSALVESLKAIDGPKTVVLLSEGMVLDPRLVDLGLLAAMTRDARVTIYGLHVDAPLFEAAQERVSPTLARDVQLRQDGLERLAGAARGTTFRLVGTDPRPFARISEEISAYYLLAFEPTDDDRDGRVHRINVRLARERGSVRARTAFRMPVVAPSARTREAELVTLLRSPRPATELPLRVATFVYGEPASADLRVVVGIEAEPGDGVASEILLGYALIDEAGVIAASGAQRASGHRHSFSTRVPPGVYTLRVGGIDLLERRGLVQRSFTAALHPQSGMRVSDIILAPVPATPDAPLEPLVDRIDAREISGYVEVYAATEEPLQQVKVTFAVARPGAAAPLVEVDGTVARYGQRWANAKAVLPLDLLDPGQYVAIVRVLRGDDQLARGVRPFTRLEPQKSGPRFEF